MPALLRIMGKIIAICFSFLLFNSPQAMNFFNYFTGGFSSKSDTESPKQLKMYTQDDCEKWMTKIAKNYKLLDSEGREIFLEHYLKIYDKHTSLKNEIGNDTFHPFNALQLSNKKRTRLIKSARIKLPLNKGENYYLNSDVNACIFMWAVPQVTSVLNDPFVLNSRSQPHVTKININTAIPLSNNDPSWSDEYNQQVANFINKNTEVTDLVLWMWDPTSNNIKQLSESLKSNTNITNLDLNQNNIGDDPLLFLTESLELNTTLQDLNIGSNKLTDSGLESISNVFSKNKSLKHIDLGGYSPENKFSPEGLSKFVQAVSLNQYLTHISFSRVNLSEGRAVQVAKLLEDGKIESLDLSHCSIGPDGGEAIGNGLQKTTALDHLNLAHNKLGDVGAAAIGTGISLNSGLNAQAINPLCIYLNLEDNGIGDKGFSGLNKCFTYTSPFYALILKNNNIGNNSIIKFTKTFTNTQNLSNVFILLLDFRENIDIDSGPKKELIKLCQKKDNNSFLGIDVKF